MQDYLNAISLFPPELHKIFSGISPSVASRVNEIRFRLGNCVTLDTPDGAYFLTQSGRATLLYGDSLICSDSRMLQELVVYLSRRSIHTYQDMIAKGFIPLRNGAKAGVVGCAVLRNGAVSSVSSFNSVNIRVCRENKGCASSVLSAVGEKCRSFLIVGPPLSGKTTVLRDICRTLSSRDNLHALKCAVIDERDEIAARAFGEGRDVGVYSDVLSLYPKHIGMETALRMLSPDVIILDEIGSEEEARAMLSAMNSGVGFIATAHAGSINEALRRPNIKKLVDGRVFQKAVLLKGKDSPCEVEEVVELV